MPFRVQRSTTNVPTFNVQRSYVQRFVLWTLPALLVLFSAFSHEATAQDNSLYIGSDARPVRVSIQGVYQQYSDENRRLRQISFPVSVFVPLARQFGFSVITSSAVASGDDLEDLSGFGDAQVALSYFRELFGDASMVFSVGANLPSGKRTLTTDEFSTSSFLSQDYYNFRTPVFGQGMNLMPALTIVVPAGDQVALGVGVSYQLKGSFEPVRDMLESFAPGNELLITGGGDVRLGTNWALSGDVTWMKFQADKLGDLEVYQSGNQVMTSLQLLGNLDANQLLFFARYKTRSKSTLPANGINLRAPRTVPEQVRVHGAYRIRIQDTFHASLIAAARVYGSTSQFSSATLIDIGATQEIRWSREMAFVTRFMYSMGSFPGVEIGAGLVYTTR